MGQTDPGRHSTSIAKRRTLIEQRVQCYAKRMTIVIMQKRKHQLRPLAKVAQNEVEGHKCNDAAAVKDVAIALCTLLDKTNSFATQAHLESDVA